MTATADDGGVMRLLPCPFCGFDTPYLFGPNAMFVCLVTCPQCDCCGPETMERVDAASKWNTRAPPQPTPSREQTEEGEK